MKTRKSAFVAALFAIILIPTISAAAEIKVICTVGFKAALEVLKPQFERASGHTLAVTYGTTVPLKRQIDAGESFDAVVLTPPAVIQDLVKDGKVAQGSVAEVAKTGLGVAIRSGTPKPDLSTSDAFKRTLLASKSIVYAKEGASGMATARTIERLGITEEMKPKTVLETRSGASALAVVEGKADLGFALISELLSTPGADFAGPFPPEIQTYLVFSAGVSSTARDAKAARDFIEFLRTVPVRDVYREKGMEAAN